MAFEHKPNEGSLFRNERKETDNHPDHNGSCKVTCPHCGATTEFWLAAWVNQMKTKAGKYFNLRFNPKNDQPVSKPASQPKPEDFDDDIPF